MDYWYLFSVLACFNVLTILLVLHLVRELADTVHHLPHLESHQHQELVHHLESYHAALSHTHPLEAHQHPERLRPLLIFHPPSWLWMRKKRNVTLVDPLRTTPDDE